MSASDGVLRRQLGLGSAVALVVGEVVGAGIFLTPAGMARSLGSPLLVLLVWFFMGAVALCGALCLGELASRYPAAGGQYVYLREAYGPHVAFLFGWMCLLVLDPGITAALALGLASYVGYVVELSGPAHKAVAVGAVVALSAANAVGVRLGAGLLRWLTAIKLGLLVFLAGWGFGRGLGDWANLTPFVAQRPGSDPLGKALAAGMIGAFFAFGGWWDVSKMAGEVRDPGRTLPRALVLGVSVVTVVYVVVSLVFLYLVPMEKIETGETFAAQAGEALFGRAGGDVFSAVVIVAVSSSLTAVIMGASRVYYVMGVDGLFLPALAVVHPRFGTPVRAIAVQAVLASVLVLFSTFGEVLGYFVFVAVVFLELTVLAVFVLRRRSHAVPDYRTPGYPLTPLFFLVSTAGLLVLLILDDPTRAAVGIGVVPLGVPVYHLIFQRRGPAG
jgi:basic amino acid/polyamine antiporter, APA family